ncbi:AAA domain-containing protein [Shimia abyssi]|uniref:Uncharacterized protein DUF559 n=1 Tax=Shimia abyssi TaxID=1662395 RepID=A0A2P8F2X5_9RHOB|nr:AAA domain-containing protein [Shimia abyssi]PSL16036.1 uncharacterized protein DUF559 [Shimia abyssi]
MSAVLKTIEAFPRGRTGNELYALLDVNFTAAKREEILAELLALQKQGLVQLGHDNKWRAASRTTAKPAHQEPSSTGTDAQPDTDILVACPAHFLTERDEAILTPGVDDFEGKIDPNALLKYYRAALQSDPRGSLTQAEDRHGTAYQLLSGVGDPFPETDHIGIIRVKLDHLPDSFREALTRREANDPALAVGWPIAIGKKSGAPAIRPVGLVAATWSRNDDDLIIDIEADDVMVNPDWVKSATAGTAWSATNLAKVFAGQGGAGLERSDFLARLREASAKSIRGHITGRNFATQVDPMDEGIFDALGLFLPTESPFTAGAVRNLDEISSWDREKISRTALGPLIGLAHEGEMPETPPVNVGPLNHEQIRAVANSTSHPLSVVTGPPGTGKSQAIVAIAATTMLQGGSVVVASKNHQALDAVEERLAAIAPKVPFAVRTLDPKNDIDQSLKQAVSDLVNDPGSAGAAADALLVMQLSALAERRLSALEKVEEQRRLQVQLAKLNETILLRGDGVPSVTDPTDSTVKAGLLRRIWAWLFSRRKKTLPAAEASLKTASLKDLTQSVENIRTKATELGDPEDPVALTNEIEALAQSVLRQHLGERSSLSEEQRLNLSRENDDLELHGSSAMSRSIAEMVLYHRPLWLASVLGTPKRIPLYEGLYDLVIFDEASQCDIASALPLLARAKRAVIVGDDRQLAFISQIGVKQDRNLMAANGLPSRGTGRFSQGRKSLFDLARSTPDVPAVMLRDQYRSAEGIVGYINDLFYGGKLRVSANMDCMKLPTGRKSGLAWADVPAPAVPSHGTQNINSAEVQAVTAEVKDLLLSKGYNGSIGVIAPFRAQVQELQKSLKATIPTELWQKAELRVGTVDGFQGQERDLILFSPTVHSKIRSTATTFLQRDWRRLNVAISRARAIAHVFGDLNYARSGQIKQLQSLAARATEPRVVSVGEGVFDSDIERVVFHKLKERGLDPKPQYDIAGRRLDFALFGEGGIKLDLEVDGRHWHQDADGNRKLDDHWRDHQMRSLGWKVQRFWVDELMQDMEGCLDLVERQLG